MEDVRVIVIGAGFGGLGAAIRLREEGIDDVVVLGRAGDLRGTGRGRSAPPARGGRARAGRAAAAARPRLLLAPVPPPPPPCVPSFVPPPAGDPGLPRARRRRL